MAQNELLLIMASAFFGAFGTLLVQEVRAKRKQNQRIATIRNSLYSEIRENHEILNDIQNPNGGSGNLLSLATYEAVCDEIGLLTPSETDAVIRYYSRANEMNSLGEKIEAIPSDELRDGMTHHVVLDSWRRARSDTLSAADRAMDHLDADDIAQTD